MVQIVASRAEHPLKVVREKAARGLAPRSFTAEELWAAAAGPLALTPGEHEIEQVLNRRASRRIDLRAAPQTPASSSRACQTRARQPTS